MILISMMVMVQNPQGIEVIESRREYWRKELLENHYNR